MTVLNFCMMLLNFLRNFDLNQRRSVPLNAKFNWSHLIKFLVLKSITKRCTNVALSLSLLHNFIQLSLNSGSAQVQILLAACRRFAMVRISDNGLGWKKKAKRLSSVNLTTKTIHHHHHRHHHHHHKSTVSMLIGFLLKGNQSPLQK